MTSSISFIPLDRKYPHLEGYATDIACFLYRNRELVSRYYNLMKVSGRWTVSNGKQKVREWCERNFKRDRGQDIDEFRALLIRFFDLCGSDEEVVKLRGLIPEKLVEFIFRHRFRNSSEVVLETGCEVLVNGNPVRYYLTEQEKKRTVDVGVLERSDPIAEFVEIKCLPLSFQNKDIQYLRILSSVLKGTGIRFGIFLVSLSDADYIRICLDSEKLWEETDKFHLYGNDNLYELMNRTVTAA
ncbi:hypothetical protein [Tumebacillus flagellatus]|uniref:Uncharacterized protein n=1 Tax=Tumebacillus flagellatus TaxID=1157490 RepID=A0A074LLP0_9BACL|nr:hypothetical protein [Tumebacillus flagellatus]KEO81475.1 hypothetical protein EL26_20580 [Tumebacillus flagellatus]